MSKLIDADTLAETLTSQTKNAMPTFMQDQIKDMDNLIKVVKLQYPNFKYPETITYDLYYSNVKHFGEGCEVYVLWGKGRALRIEKIYADSELEVLKYCSETYSGIISIFNGKSKKILYCAKKEAEDAIRENIVDHCSKIWKNKPKKLELPSTLFE